MNLQSLVGEANAISAELIALRRELHQIPELGLTLPQTKARIMSEISGLGQIFESKALDCIVLVIEGLRPGRTVLLRADMDALPVTEDTGVAYSSTNGSMHACGHDLHMAAGVGAAKLIFEHRHELSGKVVIWFQPGEETFGGADIMLDEKLHLVTGEVPIAAYGIHVFSQDHNGIFGSKVGPMMAASGGFIAKFKGVGGHGSMPWKSHDPISPMVEAISTMQNAITKRIEAFDPVVVNVGWIRGGSDQADNLIPEEASFGATVRTFSEHNGALIKTVVEDVLQNAAKAFDVSVEIIWHPSTKVLENDAAAVARSQKVAGELFGENRYFPMKDPIAGGEDFASVLAEIPGAFVFLGAADTSLDRASLEMNHSPKARFDDSVIPLGAAFLAAMAFDTLNEASL